jgi:hypothetical protein
MMLLAIDLPIMTWSRQTVKGYALSEINKYSLLEESCHRNRRKRMPHLN